MGAVVSWVLFGLLAGAVARLLVPGRQRIGCLPTIAVGIVGALVGYFIFRAIGIGDADKFDLGGIVGAIVGTMLVLIALRMVRGGGGRTTRSPRAGARL